MCTLIIDRRANDPSWPLLMAANRDELASRPARPPARHWPERADVVAGLDVHANGSWMGLNDDGLVAAILNRRGTLGPETGKRSRGEIVLEALDHATAEDAAEALAALDPDAYRPFNLILADIETAWWLRHAGDGRIERHALPEGLSMITARELNDPSSPRITRYRPLFAGSPRPQPAANGGGDWSSWQLLLASRASASGDPADAMNIDTGSDYGTRSASLLALPRDPTSRPVWLFADGRPDEVSFTLVAI